MENTANITEETDRSSTSKKRNGWFGRLFSLRQDDSLRDTIEELIEEESDDPLSVLEQHERTLLANILKLRDLTAEDVMIPRADIIAVPTTINKKELLKIYAETPRSRLPIYDETLDHIRGTVHIKDFMGQIATEAQYDLLNITRDVPVISPSLSLLDLLMQMQQTKNHMALVIDEFGGIDGLVTLGDVIEAITGEIDDIYDEETTPKLQTINDNTWLVDARLPLEELEETLQTQILDEDDREEIDTVAGLLFSIAGRVPTQGELIRHDSSYEFQVVDGDTRRIRKIKIRQLSSHSKKHP